MRAFVRLREMLGAHREPAAKLKELEKHIQDHDESIEIIFEAIRQLIDTEDKPKRKIGFEVKEAASAYSKRKKKKA